MKGKQLKLGTNLYLAASESDMKLMLHSTMGEAEAHQLGSYLGVVN